MTRFLVSDHLKVALLGLICVAGVPRNANAALVGFWSGNGNANDSTGNNPGTLVNGVSFAAGLNGQQAFSFNGSSYVQAGTQGSPSGSQDRTLDLWFNETSPIAAESFLAGYGAFGNNSQAYEVLIDHRYVPPGVVSFSQWGQAIFGPTIQDGQWYNLAVTTSSGFSTLYLDGTDVGSGSFVISTPSDTAFYIGAIGNSYSGAIGNSYGMNGLIQDVAIFSTALSGSEIQSLMASELNAPATIGVSNISNARIISGGTATLGTTVTNSATGGANNLNYTLAASIESGSGTLGLVTPATGRSRPRIKPILHGVGYFHQPWNKYDFIHCK